MRQPILATCDCFKGELRACFSNSFGEMITLQALEIYLTFQISLADLRLISSFQRCIRPQDTATPPMLRSPNIMKARTLSLFLMFTYLKASLCTQNGSSRCHEDLRQTLTKGSITPDRSVTYQYACCSCDDCRMGVDFIFSNAHV